MNNLTFLILVGVLSTQLCCYFCHLIELEKVVAFPEPNIVVFNSYKVRRVNRTTYALGGNITIKEDMDDTFNLFLVANNWQGTTYNKIIDKKFDGFCKMLYSAGFRYKYMKLKKISNLPEHGTCPLAKGIYAFENYLEEDKGLLPEYMPGNEKWKFDKMYYKGTELVGGYSVYVSITKEREDTDKSSTAIPKKVAGVEN